MAKGEENQLAVVITYRLLRVIRKLAISRIRFLLLFFIIAWLTSAGLFYWSEHIVAGRADVDWLTSLYWALITMATVGYGDIVPSRGIGWAVAAVAAVFGISVYTLFISTIADRFLEATVKASMGLGKLVDKEIVVIGEGPICEEAINELLVNRDKERIGWIMTSQPKVPPKIDFVVGELNEETLIRGGVGEAYKVIVCFEDDSKAIHATALVKRVNPNVKIVVLAKNQQTVKILEMLGADIIITMSILGRLLASGGFEPMVVRFISDATTAREGVDIAQEEIKEETSVESLESTGKRVVAIVRDNRIEIPSEKQSVRPGDIVIYVREQEKK